MPKLEVNVPVESAQPTIVVELDPQKPLPRGRHRFQLEVVDDSGNLSEPDVMEVIVADRTRPTAVLNGPSIVDIGKPFEITGVKSFDIGGVIKTYRFTYLGPTLN